METERRTLIPVCCVHDTAFSLRNVDIPDHISHTVEGTLDRTLHGYHQKRPLPKLKQVLSLSYTRIEARSRIEFLVLTEFSVIYKRPVTTS